MYMDSGNDRRLDRGKPFYFGQGEIEENLLEEECVGGGSYIGREEVGMKSTDQRINGPD